MVCIILGTSSYLSSCCRSRNYSTSCMPSAISFVLEEICWIPKTFNMPRDVSVQIFKSDVDLKNVSHFPINKK